MSIPTLSPPLNPAFEYSEAFDPVTDRQDTQKGYRQTQSKLLHDPRTVVLNWPRLNLVQMEYFVSFFTQQLAGTRGPFYFVPFNKVIAPSGDIPTLTAVTGTQGPATYYVRFTWYDATDGETTQSGQGSITIASSKFMKVQVPPIPQGAGGWRIYAHETSGSECLQATITDSRTWTQSGALATGTATPPSTNTLAGAIKWLLVGACRPIRFRVGRYRLQLTFEEELV